MKQRLLFLFCGFLLLTHQAVAADTLTIVRTVPIPVENIQADPSGNWMCENLKDSIIMDGIITYNSVDSTKFGLLLDNTRYCYRFIQDSLFCLGYENATTIMEYNQPQMVAVFPLQQGVKAGASFKGTGEYCHLLPLRVEGETTISVVGLGSLYLPNCKKDSVFCLHVINEYSEDARRNNFFREDNYLWFRNSVSVPMMVLKEMRSLNSETTVSRCMYYFVLEPDDAQAEEEVLLTEPIEHSLLTDVRFLPNPVVSELTIVYNLDEDADVWVSLHTGQGIPMFRSNAKHIPAGEHTELIDMSGYPTSDYVLYLYANDVVVSETIIKL